MSASASSSSTCLVGFLCVLLALAATCSPVGASATAAGGSVSNNTALAYFNVTDEILSTWSSSLTNFMIYVDGHVSTVTASAQPEDATAQLQWSTQTLTNLTSPSYQQVQLNVTSAAGYTCTYSALVTVASRALLATPNGTDLAFFNISNSLLSTFIPADDTIGTHASNGFMAYIPYDLDWANATASAVNSDAKLDWSVQSVSNLTFPSYAQMELNVTSPITATTRQYWALVVRSASPNASLASLESSAGAWTVEPTADTLTSQLTYELTVSYATTNVSFTATPLMYGATVSWSPAQSFLNLQVSPATQIVNITVLAQDGNTTLTYTVIVTRAAAWNSSSIVVSTSEASAVLSPSFTGTTLVYTLTVANDIDSVDFSASLGSSSATTTVSWRPASAETDLPTLPATAEATVLVSTSTSKTVYIITVQRSTATTTVASPTVTIKNTVTSVTIGTSLTLTATVTSYDSSSVLAYAWTCTSTSTTTPTLDLTDTTKVITSAANSATLTLNASYALGAGTYKFTVTVTDSVSSHVTSSGGVPTGTASTSVKFVSFVTTSTTDPCLTESPCLNGATCTATALSTSSSGTTYSMSCTCTTSPYHYYGPTCAFSLFSCSNCISSYTGGTEVTLYGVGLDYLTELLVAGVSASYSSAVSVNSSTTTSSTVTTLLTKSGLTTIEYLTFTTPALVTVANSSNSTSESTESVSSFVTMARSHASMLFSTSDNTTTTTTNPVSAYKVLTMEVIMPTATAETELNYTSLLYYSSSTCLAVGEWQPDGAGGCTSCPTGGYCPGGGRCWPIAGFWSYTEYQAPLSCIISDACPGVDEASETSSADSTSDTVDTQLCSTGYTGTRCSQCADGYYQLSSRCYYCGSSTDQNTTLVLTILVALGAMTALAIAVAFLAAVPLAYAAQLFVILQTVAQIGVDGASDIPVYTQTITAIFTYFNFINFDLEILKPGCSGVPTFTYVTKFWYTILFMLFVGVLFIIACLVRFCLKSHRLRVLRRIGTVDAWLEEEEEEETEASVSRPTAAAEKEERAEPEPGAPESDRMLITVGGEGRDKAGRPVAATSSLASLRASVWNLWRRTSSGTPWLDFKQRMQHATLILLSIFYLRLTILQLKAFQCEMSADPTDDTSSDAVVTYSLYLTEDLQTLCYQGSHLFVVVVTCLLFVFYTFGFPFTLWVGLTRAFANATTTGVTGALWKRFRCLRGKKKRVKQDVMAEAIASPTAAKAFAALAQPTNEPISSDVVSPRSSSAEAEKKTSGGAANKYLAPAIPPVDAESTADKMAADLIHLDRVARFGYLFVGFRAAYYGWCLLVFATNLWTALVTVYGDSDSSSSMSMFLLGIMWASSTVVIAVELPYERWTDNLQKVLIGLATLAHSTVLLAVQSGGSDSAYFYVLLALFSVTVLLALSRHKLLWMYRRQGRGAANKSAVEPINSSKAGLVHQHSSPSLSGSKSPIASKASARESPRLGALLNPPSAASQDEQKSSLKIEATAWGASTLIDDTNLASPSGATPADNTSLSSPTADGVPSLSAALAEELALVNAEAAAAAKAALEAASVAACQLPPTLLEFFARSLPKARSGLGYSQAELASMIAAAWDEYRRAAEERLGAAASTSGAASSTMTAETSDTDDHSDAALTSEWRSRIRAHIEANLHQWNEIVDRAVADATDADVSSVVSASLLSPDDIVVDLLSSVPAFAPVLAQTKREDASNAIMHDEIALEFGRQAEAAEERALDEDAERQVQSTELDEVLLGIEVADEDEADESDVFQSQIEGEPNVAPSAANVGAALRALKFAAAQLVALRLKRAQSAGDSPQIAEFERLYRQLVETTVATNTIKKDELTKADDDMMAKLKRGKTTKQQKVIDAAFEDDAMLRVFRLDERDRQERCMQAKIALRREKKAQESQARLSEAQRRLDEKTSATAVIAAKRVALPPALTLPGIVGRAPLKRPLSPLRRYNPLQPANGDHHEDALPQTAVALASVAMPLRLPKVHMPLRAALQQIQSTAADTATTTTVATITPADGLDSAVSQPSSQPSSQPTSTVGSRRSSVLVLPPISSVGTPLRRLSPLMPINSVISPPPRVPAQIAGPHADAHLSPVGESANLRALPRAPSPMPSPFHAPGVPLDEGCESIALAACDDQPSPSRGLLVAQVRSASGLPVTPPSAAASALVPNRFSPELRPAAQWQMNDEL